MLGNHRGNRALLGAEYSYPTIQIIIYETMPDKAQDTRQPWDMKTVP